MATTVNNAFVEFMKEKVNLDQEKTKTARSSRDNLIDNIKGFSGDTDFLQYIKIKSYDLVHLSAVQKLERLMT